ncbi:hypothetical protein GCM10010384_19330 [Streptomyces djakartensis]|uniref:Uncharacterized protein n=1 Tax=Streptomyces djakartensis TaxID=68193 RepID=A0ABQ2ZDT3_9ACTN|nr:hypothetical protein GCM10010384_19330 [Streptomyces djakartensis]
MAIVLAARHPHLVSRLVLVDADLDPVPRAPGSSGSSGIAFYSEQEFVAGGGWEEVRDRVGVHWWSTMRLAGREALHRSAFHLTRGTAPTMRELLLAGPEDPAHLSPPRDRWAPPGCRRSHRGRGVRRRDPRLRPQHCGHNIMLDNPEGFVRATASALGEQ